MSVPSYSRKESSVDYIEIANKLKGAICDLIYSVPSKYRQSYGDILIQDGMEIFKLVVKANGIKVNNQSSYSKRMNCLQDAISLINTIGPNVADLITIIHKIDGIPNDKVTAKKLKVLNKKQISQKENEICGLAYRECMLIQKVMQKTSDSYRKIKEREEAGN